VEKASVSNLYRSGPQKLWFPDGVMQIRPVSDYFFVSSRSYAPTGSVIRTSGLIVVENNTFITPICPKVGTWATRRSKAIPRFQATFIYQ